MKKLLSLIKENIVEYSYWSTFIAGILGILITTSTVIKSVALNQVNVSLFFIILFFLLKFFFKKIESLKEEKFGLMVNSFSQKTLKMVCVMKRINWIFLLAPLLFLTIHFDDIFASKKNIDELCSENRKKTNILIANFIKKTDGDDDDFSTLLYGKLDSYTQNDDSINLKRIDKYISVNGKEYRDSVGKVFQENCSNTGLLIFGKRKDSNFFLCRIYSQNFFNQKTRYFYRENKNIIYIENPDILDFSIKSEVKIISTFIMGLLRYHNNDFESSNKLIDSALRLNKNKDDQQFVTICHLFKGDNFIRSNQPLKAVAEYQCGLLSDPNNLYLHHNLGVIYLKLGKEKDAKVEFETAKRINKGAKDSIISIYPIYLSKKRPIKKDSFFIRRDSGTIIGDILPKRKGQLKDWAKEECNVFYDNGNYGVMNNNGDTIVRGRYKSIEKFIYKNVDCFITFSGYKYGIVFHRHLDDGFSTFEIIPEYPGDKVKTKATTWIDLNENALIKFVEKKVNYKN